jgi:hypothetical protein
MPDATLSLTPNFQIYSSNDPSNTRPDAIKHDKVGNSMLENLHNKVIHYPSPSRVGPYYLSVLGQGNYSILAETNQSTIYLRDAKMITGGEVPYNFYRYYVFNAGDALATQDFAVAVSPASGDVDLYVSTTTRKPSKTDYQWYSAGWSEDTVYVPANGAGGNTTFFIAVYGASQINRNTYSIIAFMSGTEQRLEDGTPARGAVQKDKYVYYSYTLSAPGSISINLEMVNPGEDADIYVSTKQKPNKNDYEYRSLEYGNDFLTIEVTSGGTYYIGILGERSTQPNGAISYTLSLQENYQTISPNSMFSNNLVSFTKRGKLSQFKTRIFSYAEHVLVSQTLIYGRTKMFINLNATEARPGTSAIEQVSWPSAAFLISKSDPAFQHGEWSIGIQGIEDSEYFMAVSVYPYQAYLRISIPLVAKAPRGDRLIFAYYIPDVKSEQDKEDYYISPRVLDGSIEVYVQVGGLTEPSRTNYTVKWDGGVIVLPKSILEFGRYVKVAVYGSANHDNNYFSILLNPTNGRRLLLDDQPQDQRTIANDYNRYKILKPKKDSYTLKFATESCDNRPAPKAYLSETTVLPTTQDHEVESMLIPNANTDLWQVAEMKPKHPENSTIYAAVFSDTNNHVYSVYSTTSNNIHPIKKSGHKLAADPDNGEHIGIRPPPASMPDDPTKPLIYQVWLYARDEEKFHDKDPKELANMYTVCGIKNYGKLGDSASHEQVREVGLPITVDTSKTYLINVIVTDGYGIETAYHPAYIINGRFTPEWPSAGGHGVSVGGIFIFLGGGALVLYFLIGAAWNFFRKGERGVHIIPHYNFWTDLPDLVIDGVKFMVTCGKKDTEYPPTRFESARETRYDDTSSRAERSTYGAI